MDVLIIGSNHGLDFASIVLINIFFFPQNHQQNQFPDGKKNDHSFFFFFFGSL